jgi:hypothetical protein
MQPPVKFLRADSVCGWAVSAAISVFLCGNVFAQTSTNQAAMPVIQKQKTDLAIRIQNGKLLYEQGKYDAAEALLCEALKQDPANRRAAYYLDLIKEARFAANAKDRESHLWNSDGPYAIPFPPRLEAVPVPNGKLMAPAKGRRAILSALDRIRFKEVSYNLPLAKALEKLAAESRKRDPDGKGVNFMYNPHPEGPPAAGNGDAKNDIGAISIKIDPPLRDVNLAEVLSAISRSASPPVIYKIEDYAVVFSPKKP